MNEPDGNRLHDVLRDDVRKAIGADNEDGPRHVPNEVALRAVSPRPVPSIVLTILAKNPREVAKQLSLIPAQLDDSVARYPVKVELRFDSIPGFSERMTAASLVFRLGVPIILTLRARREGGHTTATEPERQRFLLNILTGLRKDPPPGSLIDIEAQAVAADPDNWGRVIDQAHRRGFHVMLSHHDLDITPEKAQALLPPEGLLDQTPGGGALIWKSATTVRTWTQDLAILRALARGNVAERRSAIMGMHSPTTRLLAPFLGAPLVYAAVDHEHAAAPGQMPFADLVHAWGRWGVDVDDAGLAPTNGSPAPRWCLIGRPAYQSLSPAMHNAASRYAERSERYFPLEIPEHTGAGSALDALRATLETLPQIGVTGGNATIPFKVPLAALADRLEGDAALLGAANTFVFDGDAVVAHNTDAAGIQQALAAADVSSAGVDALVLGAGGAAAAAVHALRDAASVTVANRTAEKAEALTAVRKDVRIVDWEARDTAASDASIIINATPLGMTGGPAPGASPLSASVLREGQTVLDTVYIPQRTPLLAAAAEAGAAVVEGTEMLLYQGAAAYRIWTGEEPPLDVMREALRVATRIPFPDSIRESVADAEVQA